ncbi:isopentenyl phosphate kinase family protein [Candidatus Roizmanbacteria bacterium]|nr:isopentenyl phosphate kinase family protein [Candidatus Roizmanbacteria bacterium]
MTKELIFVKLGGSLITDKKKPYTARSEAITRLAKEIAVARFHKHIGLVIGNGAGSFGHVAAQQYQTQKGILNKESIYGFARVQDAVARLNRLVTGALLDVGESAVTITPSSSIVARAGEIVEFSLEPIIHLLSLSMIPVVYGDVVVDTKTGCSIFSTEKLLNYIALALAGRGYTIKQLVHYGTTSGVLDSNGNTIQKITPSSYRSLKNIIKGSEGIDVTGGMAHKVEEALWLAKQGIPSYIMNGFDQGQLSKLLLGKPVIGTRIEND